MSSSEPPTKKRRLNNEDEEDYVPSDEDVGDEESEYENLSDDSNGNGKEKEMKEENEESLDDDMDDDIDDDMDDDKENNNNNNKLKIKNLDQIRKICSGITNFTATQVKQFLKQLHTLRSIDGESPLDVIKLTGKKKDLLERAKKYVIMIFNESLVIPNRWMPHFGQSITNVDWEEWQNQIHSFMNIINNNNNKNKKLSKKQSSMNKMLRLRLSACDKEQIMNAIQMFLSNHSEFAEEFESFLPKPNLKPIFDKQKTLISAIFKSLPYNKYGSNRDEYAFKRCRSSINSAKSYIISEGNKLLKTNQWDTCLEYLVVSTKKIDEFPTWDNENNNSAPKEIKNKLSAMFIKVKNGLNANKNNNNNNNNNNNLTNTQNKRLTELEKFFTG